MLWLSGSENFLGPSRNGTQDLARIELFYEICENCENSQSNEKSRPDRNLRKAQEELRILGKLRQPRIFLILVSSRWRALSERFIISCSTLIKLRIHIRIHIILLHLRLKVSVRTANFMKITKTVNGLKIRLFRMRPVFAIDTFLSFDASS